ncbi:uncharacterized protein BJ171DRAFT_533941 [Polychytrium aggregatum]|uniref:uncharacterized protein n=1 Tax=Polychytrium aggregatum TaxID=110093 RepID=UPI0022FF17AA|nr:uncharacterized protein BJ171DRAFT_533941 [Polychytrium aggregatum]KAI9193078.1 hypothetical protein BJ171DRAFT_533941 [Polychytrium aggregatum]
MVERSLSMREARGSIPRFSTFTARLALSVDRETPNLKVVGSTPIRQLFGNYVLLYFFPWGFGCGFLPVLFPVQTCRIYHYLLFYFFFLSPFFFSIPLFSFLFFAFIVFFSLLIVPVQTPFPISFLSIAPSSGV